MHLTSHLVPFPSFALDRHHIPFLFTSTSLVLEPDSYGSMKRAGEIWIQALKLGKIVRLWNVYGEWRA